jgi:hypothetical protein
LPLSLHGNSLCFLLLNDQPLPSFLQCLPVVGLHGWHSAPLALHHPAICVASTCTSCPLPSCPASWRVPWVMVKFLGLLQQRITDWRLRWEQCISQLCRLQVQDQDSFWGFSPWLADGSPSFNLNDLFYLDSWGFNTWIFGDTIQRIMGDLIICDLQLLS